jgi:hypothetical protein
MDKSSHLKTFFENELKDRLVPLENYRKKRLLLFTRYLFIAASITLVLIICALLSVPGFIIALCSTIVALIIGFGWESLITTNQNLRKEYKLKILPRIIELINPEFEYIPRQKIANSVFAKSLLFPDKISSVDGEDFMRFKVGQADIMFCEATVYGYDPPIQMFDGIFISTKFNKPLSGRTLIFPKKTTSFFRKIKFNILGSTFIVKLEDPEFEKEFLVLSEDQIEARYILTTSLMQRILDYRRKLKTQIAFSFITNRMYCIIPNSKNLFEPALFNSFLDYEFILESYEPIKLYTDIVDDLNLNLRIWSLR